MGEPIDFAAIPQARETFTANDGHPAIRARAGEDLLSTKVPELCPDCITGTRPIDLTTCTHPNAPSIGRMLAEWEPLMALAEYAWHRPNCPMFHPSRHQNCTCGLDAARAALQEVRHG